MAQNTNSVAYTRLRPLENTNVGQIVEEHVRYWKKTKDANEAKKREQEINEREFARKLNKDTFEIYDGLQPEENAGFLNTQIIDRFEENKPFYTDLARKAAAGDIDARLRLSDEKRKLNSIVGVNKVFSEKIQALEAQKKEGVYNELLDSDIDRFKESLVKGKFKVNPDYSIDIYSPGLEESLKGSTSGISKDGIVRLDSSSLYNNDFLNATYSKKADFIGNGKDIADNLLDSVNGNKTITANTKVEGIKLVKGLFAQDAIETRSFYRDSQKRGLTGFDKPLGQLSEVEQNILAEKYYDEYVLPNIQEVDNSLANRTTKLSQARTGQLINKTKKEEDEDKVIITPSTDVLGNILNDPDVNLPFVPEEDDELFNLGGKEISFGVKGNSNTNTTYNSLLKKSDGRIFAIGQKVIKENIVLKNNDGEIQYDSNGNQKTAVRENVIDVIEPSEKVLNNISRLVEKKDGKKLNDLKGLNNFLNEVKGINADSDKGILD